MAPEVMAQDLPPNDPDAERAVLGAMLADNSLIEAVTGRLVVGDFYDHAHQILFGLIAREARAGGSVDGVSLFDCARAAGSAEAVGGPAYVARVLDCGPTCCLDRHLGIVRRHSLRRQLQTLSRSLAARSDAINDPSAFLEEARHGFDGLALRAEEDQTDGPVLLGLDAVAAEPVRWLWPGWLARGTLAVLDGDPGTGKSTVALDLAARVTTGRVLPPGDGEDLGTPPAGVLLLSAEDSLSATVRPRLDAAGADCSRVHSLDSVRASGKSRGVELPADLELLTPRLVRRLGLALVIVDTFTAYLNGQYDAHKDQDVRRALRPMAARAEELGIVVLFIRHLNKLSGGAALYRGGGSIAITGAARAALLMGRDPDDRERHVLACNKCNLGPRPASLAYRVHGSGFASRIEWEGETELSPEQILGPVRPVGRPPESIEEARRLLADLLCGGPVAMREVQEAADGALVGWRTVMKAKAELKIRSLRSGGQWYWSLPKVQGCTNSCDETTPFD